MTPARLSRVRASVGPRRDKGSQRSELDTRVSIPTALSLLALWFCLPSLTATALSLGGTLWACSKPLLEM